MTPDTNLIVDGLLRWWQRRFPMAHGQRNANLYKLAAALNNYGIPYTDALAVCLRYADPTGPDPFTAREITATVASAYRRTEHGVKEWTQGTRPRRYPPPPRRTLSAAQAQALEDRLVDVYRDRWPVVSIPQPVEVAKPSPPPPPPPPILSRAEVAVKRMAQRNPAINSFVNLLDLDLSRAQVRPL
ncbi:MAG: primase C-terminal domain-containing protein [Flavobacteriales bacterium]|nr:primase C-terminal domain-containing protein [Flavobacteriales bacterium]